MRSILFTKHRRGTPYLSAWRHTVSDWGSTPATESNRHTAPSSTRSARSTSRAGPSGVTCESSPSPARMGASPSGSTNRRQARSRNFREPGTSRGFQGLESASGPMNIS